MQLLISLSRFCSSFAAARPGIESKPRGRAIELSNQMPLRIWQRTAPLTFALVVGAVAGSFVTASRPGRLPGKTLLSYMAGNGIIAEKPILLRNGFAAIVREPRKAVVNIVASQIAQDTEEDFSSPKSESPPVEVSVGKETSPWFEVPGEQYEQSLGSGAIVSPDGYVLTSHQMVEGATEIMVHLADKRKLPARLVGADPVTDVAVLKVEAQHLPFLRLADSSKVEVGDWALAIGSTYDMGQTVTLGIVSAMGGAEVGLNDCGEFIQTDAAFHPGNTGGPLINLHGEMIGINTAVLSEGDWGNGIGLAVPANVVRQVMDQILKGGTVEWSSAFAP